MRDFAPQQARPRSDDAHGKETEAKRPIVQRKLIVGASSDPLEREADRTADAVVERLHNDRAGSTTPGVRVAPATRIRRSATPSSDAGDVAAIGPEGGAVAPDLAGRIDRARSGGRSLDPMTQQRMSGAFGADFSSVRLHQGRESEQLNASLSSRAFTTGSDIFMGRSAPQAGTVAGDQLLAHELTHTLQQSGAAHRSMALVQRDTTVTENPLHVKQAVTGENPLYQGPKVDEYPKVGEVKGEAVVFEKEADKFEATIIMTNIEVSYGITIRSDKLAKAIPSNYTRAPKDVRKAVTAGVWQMKELRAIERALAHFAPILGIDRKESTRGKASQEVKFIGKVKKAIDENGSGGTLDDTTMGEYFKKQKTLGLFDAGTDSTQDFTDNLEQLEGTAVHEMAHGLFGYLVKDWVKEFDYWEDQYNESGKAKAEDPPSDYGKTNASEDLCESVMFYFVDEARLKSSAPLRHAFLAKTITAWKKESKAKKPKK